MGTSVHIVPRAQAATDEVEALSDEVLALLGLKNKKGQRK